MAILSRAALPLGLALGDDGFAVCELTRSGRGASLRRVIFEPYEGRAPAAAIGAVVRQQGWLRRPCIAGIDAAAATLHAVQLPPMPARERRDAALVEAQRLARDRETPLVVDLAALERGWMLAAAPQPAVHSLAATVEGAGLRVRAIDLEPLALGRALDVHAGDATLDIGARRSTLTLSTGGVPFVRILPGGASTAPEGLAVSAGEALDFAQSRGFGAARRLLLSGAGATAEGIAELAASVLGIPASIGTPRAELSTERYPLDFVRATAPRWLTACGLALWEIEELASCA
ncbi:MAG: hypothetical protein KGM44_02235 [bacterium]|nr:hypothetical protein [bacterium]